ncbi:MAG TPA: pyrroloquinoline quinone biosynthesis protein PqqE [Dongiaceae bacterium]|nr:pyrroloquinoline quinone biosynthesis protein PqqE [Dongiaceae bacterium]
MSNVGYAPSDSVAAALPFNNAPFWLLAELTYACPLQCGYCSNPLNHADVRRRELSTEQWIDVLRQARALGAVQLGLSGGEPCVRQDLEDIVGAAHQLGFYTNLLTSTVGLTEARIAALQQKGLDHIQVSVQGVDARSNDFFAGTDCFNHKLEMARAIRAAGLPMVLNFVVHRHNIHQIPALLELALELDAEAVELANCQYAGWALHNIDALLPSAEQLREAEVHVQNFRAQHPTAMPILFVVPDLVERKPRPCLNGWGSTLISIAPDGRVAPCQGVFNFSEITAPNVREHSLQQIWRSSDLFNRYRGLAWLPEPCRSCDQKEKDFGGCRCQALALTGDMANTDPVCPKSPHHDQVVRLLERAQYAPQDVIRMRAPKHRIRHLVDLKP